MADRRRRRRFVTLLSLSEGEIQAMDQDIEPAERVAIDATVGDCR